MANFLVHAQIDRWFGENRFKAVLLNDTHLRFVAQVVKGDYFAIGFGVSMYEVDMAIW